MLFIVALQGSVRVTSVHTEAENGLRVHSRGYLVNELSCEGEVKPSRVGY